MTSSTNAQHYLSGETALFPDFLYGSAKFESATIGRKSEQIADCDEFDVSSFRPFTHTRSEVNRVGDRLKRLVVASESSRIEAIRLFRIAHSWRESHSYPMKSIRASLIQSLRRLDVDGTTASRLKRLPAIREKLRRQADMNLSRMQDIGGCRVICSTIEDAVLLKKDVERKSIANIVGRKDYITNPKSDGYRCYHVIVKFENPRNAAFNGRRIEIQIRSRLQHSWATAVEAVGLVLNEDLKAGAGNRGWLRLFKLMSGQIALAEGCPPPPGLPDSREQIAEIKRLNEQLRAVDFLENTRYAVREIQPKKKLPRNRPEFYVLEFDNVEQIVKVRPFYNNVEGIAAYNTSERNELSNNDQRTVNVLVDAKNVEDLKNAFPNYFGDVELFGELLTELVGGRDISSYARPIETSARHKSEAVGSSAWLRPGKNRRWTDQRP